MPDFRLASAHITRSASLSSQIPESTNRTPIALGIVSAIQVRSGRTCAFITSFLTGWDLLLIFRYISERAGLPQGKTLSSQLRCPARFCQDLSGASRLDKKL